MLHKYKTIIQKPFLFHKHFLKLSVFIKIKRREQICRDDILTTLTPPCVYVRTSITKNFLFTVYFNF